MGWREKEGWDTVDSESSTGLPKSLVVKEENLSVTEGKERLREHFFWWGETQTCLVQLIHTDLRHGLCKMVRAGVGFAPENYTNPASVWRLRFTAFALLVPGNRLPGNLSQCGYRGSSGVTPMGLQSRAPLIRTVTAFPHLSSACASALIEREQHCLTLCHIFIYDKCNFASHWRKMFLF